MEIERFGGSFESGVSSAAIATAKRLSAGASCAACGKLIGCAEIRTRGAFLFHANCAERAAAKQQVAAAAVGTVPKILGVLSGVALNFDPAGCAVDCGAGMEHERFSPSAFDDSLRRGGQRLLINHEGAGLRGSFSRLLNDGGQLVFRFTLMAGERESTVADRVRSHDINGCSIAFVPGELEYDRTRITHRRAALNEISLLDGRRSAWYGTSVVFEPA